MYLLFCWHHIMPGTYRDMGYGERTVVKAFLRYQAEQMKKELEAAKR